MNSVSFYTKTSTRKKRSAYEGLYDTRNTHNFIKSVLLSTFVTKGSTVLDLGCGKGGDVKKLEILEIGSYIGIDNCKKVLELCQERLSKTSIPNYTVLENTMWDFTYIDCDVISCQFSLHYGFEDETKADATINNISKCLKKGGIFLGTIPFYKTCFEKSIVNIPGTTLTLEEPTVNKKELERITEKYNFKQILWKPFLEYYKEIYKKNEELANKMCAFLKPNKNYTVFVFEKI